MPAADSHPVPTYIVRLYRGHRDAREIAGIVEIPEQDVRGAFRSFAELKAVLTGDCKTLSPGGHGKAGGHP